MLFVELFCNIYVNFMLISEAWMIRKPIPGGDDVSQKRQKQISEWEGAQGSDLPTLAL